MFRFTLALVLSCFLGLILLSWVSRIAPSFFAQFYLLVTVFFGLLIAFVTFRLSGQTSSATVEIPTRLGNWKLSGSVAAFFLWLLLSHFLLKGSANVAVLLCLEGDTMTYPVEEGEIWLVSGLEAHRQPVRTGVPSIFTLPTDMAGTATQFGFKDFGNRYRLSVPDSSYTLTDGKVIHIQVRRNDALRWGRGQVLAPDLEPLGGAEVKVGSQKARTGPDGYFNIEIPPAEQQENLPIQISLEGYQTIKQQFTLSDPEGVWKLQPKWSR